MRTLLLSVTAGAFALTSEIASAQQNEKDVRLARLEQKVSDQQKNIQTLSKALAHSKKNEAEAQRELDAIRLDLEALGTYPLGTDDERLKQAVANRKVLEDRLNRQETASLKLTEQVREYLKTAFAADADARLNVESAIRGLDVELGIGHKPRPQADFGSLHESKVISIDSQSGLLVLNAGGKQQVRIGMTFRIMRGNGQIAEAIIARVRPDISGALVVAVYDTNSAVRLGDIATIKTK